MELQARLAPPNSLVLVWDQAGGDPPEKMGRSRIVSTRSCIAVGCLAEVDGETTFTMAPLRTIDRPDPAAFEGMLSTPSRRVVVSTVFGEKVLEMDVAGEDTMVKIWVNHDSEPDQVLFGVE